MPLGMGGIILENTLKGAYFMNITTFLLYCFIVTFTPGPTNIVILSTVHNLGIRKAMSYVYGATIAFGILLVISAVMNTILIDVVPKITIFLQIFGSLYMIYLAYQIYKMELTESTVKQSASFFSGFIMQFINPKVVLFTMTVIPSYVMPYYNTPTELTINVTVITVIGFLAFVTWVLFGMMFKEFLRKYQKAVNIIMSLFLVYSAIMSSGVIDLFMR
jgi:cysteine/O-acetylserine efflux protein